MLAVCPQCEVHFSPEVGICPGCEVYRTPLDSTVEYETIQAESLISSGRSKDELLINLVHKGFSELSADQILSDAGQRVRRTNRRTGSYRMVTGTSLMMAGGLLGAVSMGILTLYGMLAIGFTLFLAGLIQFVTGANLG